VRSRPNTVATVAYDLNVFFAVVGNSPAEVTAADVLAFTTAQYTGGPVQRLLQRVPGDQVGLSARTVRRRLPLSSVSGLFAFLDARGDVAANRLDISSTLRTSLRDASHPSGVLSVLETSKHAKPALRASRSPFSLCGRASEDPLKQEKNPAPRGRPGGICKSL
jgi:hypothetical protein